MLVCVVAVYVLCGCGDCDGGVCAGVCVWVVCTR